MNHGPPISLTPGQVALGSEEFAAICGWPFVDPFVARLLREDIPRRVAFGHCLVWTFRDPGGSLVGFGTLDICTDCGVYTGGKLHPYIPLLAINPTIKSMGYGTSIVRHLIDQAALLTETYRCHDVLFLDVYSHNHKAIGVYAALGFVQISPQPIPYPDEAGLAYVIMARRISIAPSGP